MSHGYVQNAISQVREKQASKLQEVSWHGTMLPVRSEKVRVFLVHVQDSKGEVERAETYEACMDLYDGILSESQQAVQSVQDDIKVENSVSDQVHVVVDRHYVDARELLWVHIWSTGSQAFIGATFTHWKSL